VASDTEGIRRNAAAVSALLEKRGVKTRLLEVPGAPPAVYGEILTPGAARTIVFYAHYDGQPLDVKEWATPPWEPVVRDRALDKDGRLIVLPATGKIDPGGEFTLVPPAMIRRRWPQSRPRSTL
jgi:acetylornithine deacetylase/succinyl-diaminopimelate desuccinylase-like protein